MRIRERLSSLLSKHPTLSKALIPTIRVIRNYVNWFEYLQIFKASGKVKLEFVKHSINISSSGVVAVMAVRNEISRLPFCLQHHRRIGVKEFFIVDNDSNDGTYDYLLRQRDVTLLKTAESYRNAFYGITWINSIIQTYAMNRWVLFVDADELLYFDGMDDKDGIDTLIDRLEKVNQTYMYTPMVDLYAFNDDVIGATHQLDLKYDELRNASHDVSGYRSGKKLSNELFELNGGPRSRLLNNESADPNLVKFSLIKMNSKTAYIGSSHEFYPLRPECHTVYGWLVHLKLGNKAHEFHGDPEIEKQHYGAGIERRIIATGGAQGLKSGDAVSAHFCGLNSLKLLDSAIRGDMCVSAWNIDPTSG